MDFQVHFDALKQFIEMAEGQLVLMNHGLEFAVNRKLRRLGSASAAYVRTPGGELLPALFGRRGVSVVHCPRSHAFFQHRRFPREEIAGASVNICLGTDSLASMSKGRGQPLELNLFAEMNAFAVAYPDVRPETVLQMATVNGARALGFAGRLGALTPGMKADAILVNLDRVLEDPWLTGELDVVEAFMHRAMGEDVATVVIGGRLVMEDRRFLTLDVPALYREIRKAARGIGPAQRRRAVRPRRGRARRSRRPRHRRRDRR